MTTTDHILQLHTDAHGVDYYSHLLDHTKKSHVDKSQALFFQFHMTRLDVEENNDGHAMTEEVWQAFKSKWARAIGRYDQELLDDVSNLIGWFKCDICEDKFRDTPEGKYCGECRDEFKTSDGDK